METLNTAYNIQQQEYSALRRHGIFTGVCLLAYFLLQNLFVLALRFFNLYGDFQSNASFQYAVSALCVTAVCLGFPFFLMSCRKGSLSYRKVLPFNFPEDKSKALYLILAAFAVCIGANYLAVYFDVFLENIGFESTDIQSVDSVTFSDSFLNFLCASVVAPLVEEFVFRGVIMQPLRRFGNTFAVVASAFIFGLSHGSPSNVLFAFIAGLAMGYAVVASKSLWVGIAIHFLNNFYAVGFYELYNLFPELGVLPQLVMTAVVFALGAGAFAALLVRRDLKVSAVKSSLSKGRRIRAFFINIPMLIAVGYLVWGMLLYIIGG